MPVLPREVFEAPGKHWAFLTAKSDQDFEGQYFDRKEAGRPGSHGTVPNAALDSVREEIISTVSAFANKNVEGGLLVLGISSTGEVKGLGHLNENQENSLTSLGQLLRNHAAQVKIHECKDSTGCDQRIALFYTPYTPNAICETLGNNPRAWVRSGRQNLILDQTQRDHLIRDKRIVNFERTRCCPYDRALLDEGVLAESKRTLADGFKGPDEDFLYQIGALDKAGGTFHFTNAGWLFFAANPQRVMPYVYIRLLRFGAPVSERARRGLPTFERNFSGPLSKQIRELRTFFKESGFFKTFSRRSSSGGFIDEPELPHIAVDEAVVNAVAHRDYAVSLPTECESYADAFLVINPGVVLQRNHDVPEHFSLADTDLDHMPRNSLLLEWLKAMRDEHGAAFVRALSEGTKKMRDEMSKLSLPAPEFDITAGTTCVKLFSRASEREDLIKAESQATPTEYSNLFPVTVSSKDGRAIQGEIPGYSRKELTAALRDALVAKDWFIDSLRFGRLVAHRRGVTIPERKDVSTLIRFCPAYAFQFHFIRSRYYLSIDYCLELRNVLSLAALIQEIPADSFLNLWVVAKSSGWVRGRIVGVEQSVARLFVAEQESQIPIETSQVYPRLPIRVLEALLSKRGIAFDLHSAIKKHSLSAVPNAARVRSARTLETTQIVSRSVFPITIGAFRMTLEPQPTPLVRDASETEGLSTASLVEPTVEFGHQNESANIREGITKFGAYESTPKDIELVPICASSLRERMAGLIQRLKAGQFKYRGAERTFATRFSYGGIVTVPSSSETITECKRLLAEHPEWQGDQNISRIFLVHTPEAEHALDDEKSPYYQVKRFLLEAGLPCQMVDTPTLQNPDWKDLNLALNITAKCGVTPWVLPGAIPDADFFVGLSYTQAGRSDLKKTMGYANVFNQYGRWMFYSGRSSAFDYQDRTVEFERLTKSTLERLNLSETPSVYFHYSAKFSRDDKAAILRAARDVRPKGTYWFVWINVHHNVRLYESRPETDGSLARGTYVTTSPHQFYLSTTGNNPFRKALGTPQMLEINASVLRPIGAPDALPDLKALAMQILSLTKLNWASTDSLCGEPITTKYAGDIAYLTSAFLRQGRAFKLHNVLEQTPWFI